jgi:Glucodextranase, domain B
MRKLTIVLIPLIVLVLMLGAFACGKEATPTPTPTPTPVALFLEITSPVDESTVSTGNVTVSGSTIPGAVVSISIDDSTVIADVDPNGNFQTVVPLEEGPNFIEVIASDPLDNQVSDNVTIVYIP